MHQSLEGPLQNCVFYVDRNSKMTTTAGHSFYIGPIVFFYNQVNDTGSWEPLVFYWGGVGAENFEGCHEWHTLLATLVSTVDEFDRNVFRW